MYFVTKFVAPLKVIKNVTCCLKYLRLNFSTCNDDDLVSLAEFKGFKEKKHQGTSSQEAHFLYLGKGLANHL